MRGGPLVGDILKKRREELGRNLREISDTLKIKHSYLKAIEDGDHANLPPEVYVKGYLHEYAKILDIDPESVLTTYNREVISQEDKGNKSAISGAVKKKKFRIGYLVVPALCILAAIILASIQFPPGDRASENSEPADSHVSPPAPKSEPDVPSVIPAGEEPSEIKVSGHVLNISAIDTTWIEVVIDRKAPKEILLYPGDAVEWYAENSFSLIIGNAGGVKLLFDGKEIINMGEKGQVVRMQLPADST
jgi:cytoskeleton protein RodZ